MNRKILFSVIVFVITAIPQTVYSSNIDSLLKVSKHSPDTSKLTIYRILAVEIRKTNPDSAMLFIDKGIELSEKLKRSDKLGDFYDLKGHILERKGKLNEAIESFNTAYNYLSKAGYFAEAIRSLSNLGAMLIDNGRYSEASTKLFLALKTAEEKNLTEIKSSILNNIGLLFFNQQEWDKSIQYYGQSVAIRLETKDLDGLALLYNNIGIAYYYKNMPDSVLVNFERSLKIYERLNDKLGQTRPLFNIGEVYYSKGDYKKAMEYYHKSLSLERELGYKKGVAGSLIYIGTLYADQKDFKTALKYQYEGLVMSQEVDAKSIILDGYQSIHETYTKMHNADSALHYYLLYSQLKDSLFSLEKSKQISELETIYETEKKEQQIALQQAEMKRKSIQNITLIIILVLATGLIFLIFLKNLDKRKVNKTLEEKNRLLGEQNRQITSSITYASFIQAAILPPLDLFCELFPEHFILFKPKDIVSGDFYWLTKKENRIFIAVADCTGHGVPGAFMSMLGMTFLNEIINIYGETDTDKILNILRQKIIVALHQAETSTDTRDGMDIALCSIDQDNLQLEFSGAYSPLILLSEGKISEIEPDKMPIGFHKTRIAGFHKKSIQLIHGDTIYLFTDGFSDQFGGEHAKKYTRKKFYNLLEMVGNLDIDEQKLRINSEFENWKGSGEQIDDVTVAGIRF